MTSWSLVVPPLLAGGVFVNELARWRRATGALRRLGLDRTDSDSGLASLTAAAGMLELMLASGSGTVRLVVMRLGDTEAHDIATALAGAVRTGETAFRGDYDVVGFLLDTPLRAHAVLAAHRLLDAGGSAGSIRGIGFAEIPHDGASLLDAVDVALQRLVPPSRLAQVSAMVAVAVPDTAPV